SQNFLSAAFELDSSEELFTREQQRFSRAADRALQEVAPATHRDQDRVAETAGGRTSLELGSPALPAVPGALRTPPDTDLATTLIPQWAARITRRIRGSLLGVDEVRAARREAVERVDRTIAAALEAQPAWAALGVEERAKILRRVAGTLAAHRG